MYEAKIKDQGHKRKCSPKKRFSKNSFRRSQNKKNKKKVFKKLFQVIYRFLTIRKIVLSSSRVQGNFRGLKASRPRTSKCVLEDVLKAKNVLEDSTSGLKITFHPYQSTFGRDEIFSFFFFLNLVRFSSPKPQNLKM